VQYKTKCNDAEKQLLISFVKRKCQEKWNSVFSRKSTCYQLEKVDKADAGPFSPTLKPPVKPDSSDDSDDEIIPVESGDCPKPSTKTPKKSSDLNGVKITNSV